MALFPRWKRLEAFRVGKVRSAVCQMVVFVGFEPGMGSEEKPVPPKAKRQHALALRKLGIRLPNKDYTPVTLPCQEENGSRQVAFEISNVDLVKIAARQALFELVGGRNLQIERAASRRNA